MAEAAATIGPEIPRQLECGGRIGEPNGPRMQPGVWENQIDRIYDWLGARPGFARDHLVTTLGLAGMYQLELQVDPPGRGTFELTAVTVEAPFTGTYFIGVPVTITARPADGYEWRGWLPQDLPQEQTIVVTPEVATRLTARFE